MMCPKCANRVKKALEAVEGVTAAEVSHETGSAVVQGSNLNVQAMKAAVEAAGYKVL